MILKILLIISIILQLVASISALRLMKDTKYNVSWVLFTVALCVIAFQLFGHFYQAVADKELRLPPDFFVWAGVLVSFCFAFGMYYVNKIFKYINMRDIQQKLTEKRILNTILRTEESERAHFSKELHDGLGPLLSSAKMSLSAIEPTLKDPRNEEILRNLSYVIDESIRSLREISNNLSPHTLQDFGLYRAIDSYIRKTLSINNIKIEFRSSLAARRFDNNVEIVLFRVVSELVTNSLKHAGASRIDLAIDEHDGMLAIDYADNGKGFDPQASMESGMGLSNIHSRINSLRGTISIVSAPGKGMKAAIVVDLNEATKLK